MVCDLQVRVLPVCPAGQSPSWLRTLSGRRPCVRLQCRRIGEYSNVLSYELVGAPPSHEIHQSLTPTPAGFPPGGLLLTFTVGQCVPRSATPPSPSLPPAVDR